MSFIKRSDGTTIYGGTHDVVRSFGGGKRPVRDEESEGDIGIETAMMTIGESACLSGECEEEGLELAEELWGIYDGECAHLNHGEYGDLFKPAGR